MVDGGLGIRTQVWLLIPLIPCASLWEGLSGLAMCSVCLSPCGNTTIPELILGFLQISSAFVLREVTHFCLLASPLSLAEKVTWDGNIEPEFEGLRMLVREGDTVGGTVNLTL